MAYPAREISHEEIESEKTSQALKKFFLREQQSQEDRASIWLISAWMLAVLLILVLLMIHVLFSRPKNTHPTWYHPLQNSYFGQSWFRSSFDRPCCHLPSLHLAAVGKDCQSLHPDSFPGSDKSGHVVHETA